MKNERKTEIKVGITVALSLIIFIWIFGWAKNFTISSDRNQLSVEFANASGLEVGDQVTVNGVRKGFVEEVKNTASNVMIKLSLDKDAELFTDAIVGITMLDLMGGKKVEIKPGLSGNPINYSEIKKGTFYADIPELVSMLGTIDDQLPEIMNQIKITVTSLNSYLNDQKMSEDIKTSISNLADISKQMKSLIELNKRSIDLITKNTLEITDETKTILSNNKDNINQSIENASIAIVKTDSLLSTLNSLLAETRNKQNNLGQVLYDENLIKDLDKTLKNLKELTDIALEQMHKNGLKVETKIKLF